MLLNSRVYANGIASKPFKFRNGFDIIVWGKVCNCAPVFNFVYVPLDDATRKCRIWGFSLISGDTMHLLGRNLAKNSTSWVHCRMSDFALIGIGAPKVENLVKFLVFLPSEATVYRST